MCVLFTAKKIQESTGTQITCEDDGLRILYKVVSYFPPDIDFSLNTIVRIKTRIRISSENVFILVTLHNNFDMVDWREL
jgi:hypothetical protein